MWTLSGQQDILFLHHGFPGQFYHWAAALAARGHRVVFLSSREGGRIPGVRCATYVTRPVAPGGHLLLQQYGQNVEHGCAAWRTMIQLKTTGFQPHTVITHADFGVGLFVKQAFPRCRLIAYCEWYTQREVNEWNFDPQDAALLRPGHAMQLQLSNADLLLVMQEADRLITPSEWQRSRFPSEYGQRMRVIPDGIDTGFYAPPPQRQQETPLITYVSRTMEPFRGFDKFMEALHLLMQRNKSCKALLVGQTERHEYSSAPPGGRTYREIFGERFPLPEQRVKFAGWVPEAALRQVLQASTVHVYLTRPFVLSWSFLQALSSGCTVVASATAPVLEVADQSAGQSVMELVDYFSTTELAATMERLLALPQKQRRAELGQNARRFIEQEYSLRRWLPEHCRLVEEDFV